MGEKKGNFETATKMIPSFNYVFVQSAMFFLHYGMGYKMPSWVIWFPTIYYSIMVTIFIIIFIFIVIVEAITS